MDLQHIKAVLFDLDGTLIDSAPDLGYAVDQMRIRRGLPSLPIEAYRPVAGAGARGLIGVAFEVGPEDPRFEALRDEFFSEYSQCLARTTRPFEGIDSMLQGLSHAHLQWGIVTNKSQRFTLPLCEALGYNTLAGAVVSGDTTPHSKPHPEPLFEACRRLNLTPAECIYVGDDLRDIQAGRAAGMPTVVAAYGYLGLHEDYAAWGADAVVHHPKELLQLLNLYYT